MSDLSEKKFLADNFDASANSLTNFRTAFRLYVLHYTTCREYAEHILDGEIVDEYACSYCLEQLSYAYKFCRLFKSRLLQKKFADDAAAVIDLHELSYKGIIIRDSELITPPDQAVKIADELSQAFAKKKCVTDFEVSAYVKYLLFSVK